MKDINPDKIRKLAEEFKNIKVDTSITKKELSFNERSKKSIFQWSGQFPPELIITLLNKYTTTNSVVLDPFVGSGTVLFEALNKHLTCFGVDINPAAVELSRTATFYNIKLENRKKYLDSVQALIETVITKIKAIDKNQTELNNFVDIILKEILKNSSNNKIIYNILINVLMRFSISKEKNPIKALSNSFELHKKIIEELPYTPEKCEVYLSDSRKLLIKSKNIDLILTSPPYPGVFEYYKNYKKIMYLAGFKLSDMAKNEIGSTKGLGNKVLTVSEYCTDIYKTLIELKRVLKDDGRIIIILQSSSTIKNITINNSSLFYALACGIGLKLILKQEREFIGRHNKKINEDILHFTIENNNINYSFNYPLSIAIYFLEAQLNNSKGVLRQALIQAIKKIKEELEKTN